MEEVKEDVHNKNNHSGENSSAQYDLKTPDPHDSNEEYDSVKSPTISRDTMSSNSTSKDYNKEKSKETLETERIKDIFYNFKPAPRKMRFVAVCVEDLPKDMKKMVRESRITDEEFNAHFDVLLNILHFFTKRVFITRDEELEPTSIATTETKASTSSEKLDKENAEKTGTTDKAKSPIPPPKKTEKKSFGWSLKNFLAGRNRADSHRNSLTPTSSPKDSDQLPDKVESKDKESTENTTPSENSDAPSLHTTDNGSLRQTTESTDPKEKSPEKSPEENPQEKSPTSSSPEINPEDSEDPVIIKKSKSLKDETPFLKASKRTKSKVDMHIDLYFIKQNPKGLYKNLRKAGKGGYGSVYTAKSVAESQMVAIKKMKASNSKERHANFNEVKFLKKCDHANIVKFLSCYEYKDECWLVMEYLEGGTLTDARRGHEFEENEIAYVAKELLKGLVFVHSAGLIHRDLKSSNIMMSIMGDIKLIDFGLCSEARKAKPTMLGSPHWMPPEMILRMPHTYTADIWSFGISLLELTNKHPPTAQHKVRAMWISAVGKVDPFEEPDRWSNNYKDFMSRCLEKDPLKRGTSAELLQHPFLEQASNTRKVMRKILTEVFVQRAIGLF